MIPLFALASFTSSFLLFWLQPMIAKMILPLLGGSPSVWNTCMVFFQGTLLAGYAYAHALATRPIRAQIAIHFIVLALGAAPLPVLPATGWEPPATANPILWVLGLLTVSCGMPFFALSAATPLLQKWYSFRSGRDPYALFAASNAGSLLALLSYPFVIERHLGLVKQSAQWSGGFFIAMSLVILAGLASSMRAGILTPADVDEAPAAAPSGRLILHWVALAFIPSSLLLGVTQFISTDVAAVPLMWVVPLALYLLTFISAFSPRFSLPAHGLRRGLFLLMIPQVAWMASHSRAIEHIWFPIGLHLAVFLMVCLVLHGELARSRPSARHLTLFYLSLSLGGFLGGVLNSLLAPILFPTVLEYPLALIAAALLTPVEAQKSGKKEWAIVLAIAAGVFSAFLAVDAVFRKFGIGPQEERGFLVIMVPAVALFLMMNRPRRFAGAMAALFLAGAAYHVPYYDLLLLERSYFGCHKVVSSLTQPYHLLTHGTTTHGAEWMDGPEKGQPLTYFHRSGPAGRIFEAVAARDTASPIGIVGLGAGSLAAFAERGRSVTFYEIDPVVERIARDDTLFTFLKNSPAAISVVLGDARLSLRRERDNSLALLVIDAFSSDAIPIHLLTREALRLYLSKVTDQGLVAFHISNRYLDLQPVLAALAKDAGVRCIATYDSRLFWRQPWPGKMESHWAVIGRDTEAFGPLIGHPLWHPLAVEHHAEVWTDDFTNLAEVFHW